ncbi:MAG TPA: DUF1579 family protein [Thermoanaerobaculia bacterium]
MRGAFLAAPLALALSVAPTPGPAPAAPENDGARRQRPMSFAAPAAEIRKLAALSGTWNFEETWAQPERYKRGAYEGVPGAGGSGTLTARPGPGGFSVLFDYDGRNPMGHVTALDVLSWDPARRVFELDEIHSAFPGVLHLTGRFEKGDLVFRGEDARTGPRRALRVVWKGLGEDTWTITSAAAGDHGRLEEIVRTRLRRASAP